MALKKTINDTLTRATGYQLQKVRASKAQPPPRRAGKGDRLVQRPAFILSSVRSGSTLLRVLLNSHSQIHAPHELHLRYVSVKLDAQWAVRSMRELGLDAAGLEYLLCDRVLHRALPGSGKGLIVDKTPNNV